MPVVNQLPIRVRHFFSRRCALVLLALCVAFLSLVSEAANAGCICSCRDGEMRAWCTLPYEVPPICPARACPPPAVRPSPPLAGAFPKGCYYARVCDPTGSCEVKRICQGDKIDGTVQ